ncbi:MAG TPA: restriction endonuclease subunit S, partial [Tepidisphaeraceae bacterium]|nr:restriction endonuclease subunit S [Tepidisphaeraceae bacterium]
PDQNRLLPGFLAAIFCWTETQARLKGLASRGVSQSNISAGKLKHFAMAVPSIAEQREIVAVLDACDAKLKGVRAELECLGSLFFALLEELMSGRMPPAPDLDTTSGTHDSAVARSTIEGPES